MLVLVYGSRLPANSAVLALACGPSDEVGEGRRLVALWVGAMSEQHSVVASQRDGAGNGAPVDATQSRPTLAIAPTTAPNTQHQVGERCAKRPPASNSADVGSDSVGRAVLSSLDRVSRRNQGFAFDDLSPRPPCTTLSYVAEFVGDHDAKDILTHIPTDELLYELRRRCVT